jgi:signal transduction histidine kinase
MPLFCHLFKYIGISLLLLPGFSLSAQTAKIDSLKLLMNKQPDNKKYVLSLLQSVAEEQYSLPIDTAMKYALKAEQLAQEAGTETDKKNVAYFLATAYWRAENNDTALVMINKYLSMLTPEKIADREDYFKWLVLRIRLYTTSAMLHEASVDVYKLMADAEKYNDTTNRIIAYNSVGLLKRRSEKSATESLSWFLKAANLAGSNQQFDNYPIVYGNLARAYFKMGKNDSAIWYVNKALVNARTTGNLSFLQTILSIQTDILSGVGNYDGAEKALMESIALSNRVSADTLFADDIQRLARFYNATHQYDKTIAICTKYLALDSVPEYQVMYLEPLAEAYKLSGAQPLYVQTLEALLLAKEQFYKADFAKTSLEMEARYEAQKKENTIIQQKLDLYRKDLVFYGLLAFLLIVVIIALMSFYNYKKREKLKLQLLIQREKDASLLAVTQAQEHERKRIATDLHDNLGAYAASVVSNLEFIKTEQDNEQSKTAMQQLRHNSLSIVAQLSDTIWVLKKDALSLTAISDRVKVFARRIQPSFPDTEIQVAEDIPFDREFSPAQAYHLFQIVQEAVTNSLKHSKARHVDIFLESGEKGWKVQVADDGSGMPGIRVEKSEGGNGLAHMQARANEAGWRVEWQAGVDAGTVVVVTPQ